MPRSLKTSPNSGEHFLPMEVSAHTLEGLVLCHQVIAIIDKCVMAILLYGAENWLLVATLESFQAELGKRILTLSKFAANEAPPLHSMLAHYEGKNLVPCA